MQRLWRFIKKNNYFFTKIIQKATAINLKNEKLILNNRKLILKL